MFVNRLVFLAMIRRSVRRSLRRPVVNRIAPIDGSGGRQVEEMSTGIWSQRRQIHLAAARQTEATVTEYVRSILRIAVKATSASTDLTRDPAGRACGPASSEDLEQMLEELMQEGRPNVPSEVKREEDERRTQALRTHLEGLGIRNALPPTPSVLDSQISQTGQSRARGVPSVELKPDVPDDKVKRNTHSISFAQADIVREIPPRQVETRPQTTEALSKQADEVAVKGGSLCCTGFFSWLKGLKVKRRKGLNSHHDNDGV